MNSTEYTLRKIRLLEQIDNCLCCDIGEPCVDCIMASKELSELERKKIEEQ